MNLRKCRRCGKAKPADQYRADLRTGKKVRMCLPCIAYVTENNRRRRSVQVPAHADARELPNRELAKRLERMRTLRRGVATLRMAGHMELALEREKELDAILREIGAVA